MRAPNSYRAQSPAQGLLSSAESPSHLSSRTDQPVAPGVEILVIFEAAIDRPLHLADTGNGLPRPLLTAR
jgi:hypothetical protein